MNLLLLYSLHAVSTSPTTVTSLITSQAGSSNWTAAKAFRGKATTPPSLKRLAQEASQEAARRKSIEKELEWVRQGAKGRQSKGKARLARFEELNNTEYQKRNETNELFIPPGARLGNKVVEVSNLRKSYGDRLLIDDLSFSAPSSGSSGRTARVNPPCCV